MNHVLRWNERRAKKCGRRLAEQEGEDAELGEEEEEGEEGLQQGVTLLHFSKEL